MKDRSQPPSDTFGGNHDGWPCPNFAGWKEGNMSLHGPPRIDTVFH
jgi:hypothetical protein